MEAVLIIVDDYARTRFEKKWQIPFGYSNCKIYPLRREKEAMKKCSILNSMRLQKKLPPSFCVEKVDAGVKEIVFRSSEYVF